jgi:coenzyme F420-0:L-glutamate ligase/coenzyme F420-1:gamma-L-glutamate ligase
MAVADEIASAAELAMNKADGVPAVIVRGYRYHRGRGWGRSLIRPKEEDLFR